MVVGRDGGGRLLEKLPVDPEHGAAMRIISRLSAR